MNRLLIFLAAALPMAAAAVTPWHDGVDVPVFITIGQSNADGSALADPAEDARLDAWYSSEDNPGMMKMWYRSSYIQNQPDGARWVMDGTVTDAEPGWLDLWWRNDQDSGRTMMNMIHSYGTWSGDDKARGRRGMEGEFGMRFEQEFPQSPLYMVKLGCSGSAIATWDPAVDGHNWEYFKDSVYRPAIESLLDRGLRPRLAGVWWMQGCGDQRSSREAYERSLRRVISNLRDSLGFPEAHVYVGMIVKPGESARFPKASTQYSDAVREAQLAVASQDSPARMPYTELVDTRGLGFIPDNLHFDHRSVNEIGRRLAESVAASGRDSWDSYVTPGRWDGDTFVPLYGNPRISYERDADGSLVAVLDYGSWRQMIVQP